MVLCSDSCRLQSHSHSEDLGCNGMSLSGGLKMKQKHSHYRDCSADRGLSTLLLHSQTSRKIRLRTNFFSSLLDLNALDLRSQGGSIVHADRVSLSGVRALPAADKDTDAKSESDDPQR